MRRVLAACCFVWFCTKLIAAYLPPAALGLLAAVFVCPFYFAVGLKRRNYWMLLPLTALCALAFHLASYSIFVAPVFRLAGQEKQAVLLVETADAGFQDGTIRGQFTVLALDGEELPVWKRFKVSCTAFPESERGEIVSASIKLAALEQNEYYYGNLADGVLLAAEPQGQIQHTGQSHAPRFWMKEMQERLARSCRRYLPAEEGAVLSAMAVGDKSHLTDQLQQSYRAAGVSHLLVVSGLHLTLLCGAFVGNRPGSGRFRRLRAVGAMLLVCFMMALTGFTPSVTRAGIAALLFYLGALLLQPSDSFTSLGVAAAVLSVRNCYAVCDLGLQLSFAATLGVLLAGAVTRPGLTAAVREEHPLRYRLNQALSIVLVPVFSALFTLPLQLLHGLPVSGVSVLTNLLTIPLVGPIVLLGLLAAVTGLVPVLYPAARAFSLLAGLLTKLLNAIVEVTAGLPAAQLVLPTGYTLFVLLVLFALGWAAWKLRRMPLLALAAPCITLTAAFLYGQLEQPVVSIALTGSTANPCAVVISEGEAMVLFKGGESNRQAVEEALAQRGIGEADLWIDLRQAPKALQFKAGQVVTLEEIPADGSRAIPFCGIMVTLVNTDSANLALLELEGYRVAMLAGKLEAGTPVPVDLLLAGSSEPGAVEPRQVLCAKAYDWQAQRQDVTFRYAPLGGTVRVRPGRAVMFEGVTDVT